MKKKNKNKTEIKRCYTNWSENSGISPFDKVYIRDCVFSLRYMQLIRFRFWRMKQVQEKKLYARDYPAALHAPKTLARH